MWLHGGGFTFGWSGSPLYDGGRLAAAQRVIVVSANYRLGSLGWMCHEDLRERESAPAGNWGLLDQAAALEWVADHIEAFGGDPARVTLAGQSAGALSALDHLVSGTSSPPFRRAIIQSAPVHDAAGDPDLAQRWAVAMSERAGGRRGAFDLDALRAATPQEIVAHHERLLDDPAFAGSPLGGAMPIVDAPTLAAPPMQRPAARLDVDVLAGWTADEGTFFFRLASRPRPDDDGLVAIVGHLHPAGDPEKLVAGYRARAGSGVSNNTLLVAIASELMVAVPIGHWARERAGAGATVYTYRVDHGSPTPGLGAVHMIDVPLVFGTYASSASGRFLAGATADAGRASTEMMDAWGAFVREGNPGWEAHHEGAAEPGHVFGAAGPLTRRLRHLQPEPKSARRAARAGSHANPLSARAARGSRRMRGAGGGPPNAPTEEPH